MTWVREITLKGTRTSNAKAKAALKIIHEIYEQDQKGASMVCPVLAYYGAGRAWLPSHERASGRQTSKAGRWAAFYDCFEERIRFADLRNWFQREAIEAGNRGGQTRPGFDAVRQAILGCVPGCDGVHFDADQAQIVLSIKGDAQPFDNLSAGQRMMLALVADIAIKAVTQNAHLLPHPVLAQTPGVVLIDELDVHLHPSWQRRVATDLQRTFPLIQFVCTSHSPQVIGELPQQQVRLLDGEGRPSVPAVARGADSNWILDHVLASASSANAEARRLEREAETALEADKLDVAHDRLDKLRQFLQGEHGTLARLESSLATLRALAAPDGDGA